MYFNNKNKDKISSILNKNMKEVFEDLTLLPLQNCFKNLKFCFFLKKKKKNLFYVWEPGNKLIGEGLLSFIQHNVNIPVNS